MNHASGGGEPSPDLFERWLAHRTDPVEQPAPTHAPPAAPLVVEEAYAAPANALAASLAEAAARPENAPVQRADVAVAPAPRALPPLPSPTPPKPAFESFVPTRKPEPPARPDAMPAVTEFARRQGSQRIAGLLLSATFVSVSIAGYLAWHERSTASIGIAGTLFLLMLVIWASRASSSPPAMKVNSGHLTVTGPEGIRHFDLASEYTKVRVRGRAGRPGWQVVLEPRDQQPFTITGAMVDARAFQSVLRYYRPEV